MFLASFVRWLFLAIGSNSAEVEDASRGMQIVADIASENLLVSLAPDGDRITVDSATGASLTKRSTQHSAKDAFMQKCANLVGLCRRPISTDYCAGLRRFRSHRTEPAMHAASERQGMVRVTNAHAS